MMHWFSKHTKVFTPLIILSVVALRVVLTGVNAAEWGDSYRILRASNFVREFSYPEDEKRPPLFSILLAFRPENIDAILWGRVVMLAVSFATMVVFYKLSRKFLATAGQNLVAFVILFLSPVYLYWSLRIYADIPFSLLVLLCFYVFEVWKEKQLDKKTGGNAHLLVMGFICGLGILTRFEGYLLTAAIGVGLLISLKTAFKVRLKTILLFSVSVVVVVTPWLIYRNPFTSAYFEEPAGRKYDLTMFLTYLISYLFVLGIIPAAAFIIAQVRKSPVGSFSASLRNYPHIILFVLLESLLILAWPAAVPRLFVPIIPLMVIAFVKYFNRIFELAGSKPAIAISAVLILLYALVQYKLRLQFLGSHTMVFILVLAISVLSLVALAMSQKLLFLLASLVTMLALSFSTIYLHKDIYRTIRDISIFPLREPAVKVVHNDTAGIVTWYHPESEYKNLDDKKYLTEEYLLTNNVTHVIISNEFNPDMEIDLKKRPYLTLIKKSENVRGGKMFYTWLVKVQQ